MNEHVAVLIDADNAQLGYTERILKLSEYYGTVDICRAYGDWQSNPLSPWREKMPLKVERIQVDRVGKNATDHRLLIEAGEILAYDLSRDDIDIFVIVSGDGDYASACQLIQERGRRVIVIGDGNNMSNGLRDTCDTFFRLQDLDDELKHRDKIHPIPPSEVRAFWDVLHLVYITFYKTRVDWITLSELDEKLREFRPDYESRFGKYRLSEWLRNFDWYFEINDQMIRKNPRYIRYSLLVNAYWETNRRFGSAPLSQFGTVLRELDPDYKGHFGGRNLSGWLKDYRNVFNINEDVVTLSSRRIRIFS
ncbi:MAG: NYN domain-containing protein [Anaerolineae bacterium]|nr:NYN domain-containing protein [Anaerolineae bacterium]